MEDIEHYENLEKVYERARELTRKLEKLHPLALPDEERGLMDAVHAAEAT